MQFQCNLSDEKASWTIMVLLVLQFIYYILCDFRFLKEYFGHILSPHIYFCICMAAMVWRHVDGEGLDSSLVISEIIGLCIVSLVAIWKMIKMLRESRRYAMGGMNGMEQNCNIDNIDDDYQRNRDNLQCSLSSHCLLYFRSFILMK